MNIEQLTKSAWLALLLLGAAYTLLGWYLSAHDLFWFISIAVLALSWLLAGQPNPILVILDWLRTQKLLLVISGTLLFSLVVIVTITTPLSLTLFVLPLLTLLYARLEIQTAGLSQKDLVFALVLIAGLGLGLGEVIDLFVVPSMRY